MQHIVRDAIQGSAFSRRELARRAGVSGSTVTRIEKGEVDPTYGMAARILAATGLQMPARAEPLCDMKVIAAARRILGGDTEIPESGMEETLIRWASPDGQPHPRQLAREAAVAAPPRRREGVVTTTSDWGFLRICSAAAATRKGWAASGAPAAARIGAPEQAGPVILYAEDPARVASIVGRPGASAVEVIVLPFDGASESGAWSEDGLVWADPLQVILDCYGMPETADLADELTKGWNQ